MRLFFSRALALCFAVVAGLNFEVFADATSGSFDLIEVFGTVGVTLGSSILKKYTVCNNIQDSAFITNKLYFYFSGRVDGKLQSRSRRGRAATLISLIV